MYRGNYSQLKCVLFIQFLAWHSGQTLRETCLCFFKATLCIYKSTTYVGNSVKASEVVSFTNYILLSLECYNLFYKMKRKIPLHFEPKPGHIQKYHKKV